MKLANTTNHIKSALFGVAIGDALGVPVEFKKRNYLNQNPVTDMIGYGTHHQPAGTWSDDSSLTFCLTEALVDGYSLEKSARNFIRWKKEGYWAAHNEVFDIGNATSNAIERLSMILSSGETDKLHDLKGYSEKWENGNGSLMRILPLLFELRGMDLISKFNLIWENSALTHRHLWAAMACMIYLTIAELILDGANKFEAYSKMKLNVETLLGSMNFNEYQMEPFDKILKGDITKLTVDEIKSSGYVVDTLEASIWCILTTDNYKEAVLKAVNLGEDTDTTAAVTGGLAGLLYGYESIPEKWLSQLARKDDIDDLAIRLSDKY